MQAMHANFVARLVDALASEKEELLMVKFCVRKVRPGATADDSFVPIEAHCGDKQLLI
jgi:hypothetical protein